jgi:hypothetical protein
LTPVFIVERVLVAARAVEATSFSFRLMQARSAQDNKDLGGVAPSKYRSKIPARRRAEILRRALCPPSLFSDDYERFKDDRAALLVEVAKALNPDLAVVPVKVVDN